LEKTNTVLERFSLAIVIVKMRRVIEIKFGPVGGPAYNVNLCPGANRFLGFSAKAGDIFIVSLCGLSIIGIVSISYPLEIWDWLMRGLCRI
jgi:hypothetical protein